jgi:hypothetical protein
VWLSQWAGTPWRSDESGDEVEIKVLVYSEGKMAEYRHSVLP